ncbi:hypothetical protein IMSAGC003_00008 [Lachnospiraceae bacterium]|nr:hypothetical protein IMSAGC003_00008 [Lachnospiraceae bacterium]
MYLRHIADSKRGKYAEESKEDGEGLSQDANDFFPF